VGDCGQQATESKTMPRKTTEKRIDRKANKKKSRPAVALAVRDARLHSPSPTRNGSMAKNHPVESSPSRSPEGEGANAYEMMVRCSPLSVMLRQQALATAMFLSLTQFWVPSDLRRHG